MLDLKAKLASAGLVTDEDIKRVEKQKKPKKPTGPKKSGGGRGPRDHARLAVDKLRDAPKSEVYDSIRRWVEKVRLDPSAGTPPDDAKTFHFAQASGKIGRLMLAPKLLRALESGEAGLIAFMSNHGLAHAVLPADCARSLAELRPLLLRVLKGDERAGQLEPREELPPPANSSTEA